jgi:hypothetical protein
MIAYLKVLFQHQHGETAGPKNPPKYPAAEPDILRYETATPIPHQSTWLISI